MHVTKLSRTHYILNYNLIKRETVFKLYGEDGAPWWRPGHTAILLEREEMEKFSWKLGSKALASDAEGGMDNSREKLGSKALTWDAEGGVSISPASGDDNSSELTSEYSTRATEESLLEASSRDLRRFCFDFLDFILSAESWDNRRLKNDSSIHLTLANVASQNMDSVENLVTWVLKLGQICHKCTQNLHFCTMKSDIFFQESSSRELNSCQIVKI